MKKGFLSVILCAALFLILLPAMAAEAATTEAQWGAVGENSTAPTLWISGSLTEAVTAANSATSSTIYIRLQENVTTTAALEFAAGRTTVLDLNGHDINRGLTAANASGNVITVNGTLTLMDGKGEVKRSTDGMGSTYWAGTIYGGFNDGNGGGIIVNASGTLNMQSGRIGFRPEMGEAGYTNRVAAGQNGAGVYLLGTLNYTSGYIAKNETADGQPSNLYLPQNNIFTITADANSDDDTIYVFVSAEGEGVIAAYKCDDDTADDIAYSIADDGGWRSIQVDKEHKKFTLEYSMRVLPLDLTKSSVPKQTGGSWGDPQTQNINAIDAEGWAWDCQTKTLTLDGLSIDVIDQSAIVLPDGATIVNESSFTLGCKKDRADGDPVYAIDCAGDLILKAGADSESGYFIPVGLDAIIHTQGSLTVESGDWGDTVAMFLILFEYLEYNSDGNFSAIPVNKRAIEADGDVVMNGGCFEFTLAESGVSCRNLTVNNGDLVAMNSIFALIFISGDIENLTGTGIDAVGDVTIHGGNTFIGYIQTAVRCNKLDIDGGVLGAFEAEYGLVSVQAPSFANCYAELDGSVQGITITGNNNSRIAIGKGLLLKCGDNVEDGYTEPFVTAYLSDDGRRVLTEKGGLVDAKMVQIIDDEITINVAPGSSGTLTAAEVLENIKGVDGAMLDELISSVTGNGKVLASAAIEMITKDDGYGDTYTYSTGNLHYTVKPDAKPGDEETILVAVDLGSSIVIYQFTFRVPAPSGGGGGSSSGGGGQTVTVPVSSDKDSVAVSATVSGHTASVTVSDAQLAALISSAESAGIVTADVSGLSGVDAVKIPAKVVNAASSSNADGLKAILPTGAVELDGTALASVNQGNDIVISLNEVGPDELTEAQKTALGEQANDAVVVDVNVLVKGSKVTDFGGGKVKVSLPYTPQDGEDTSQLTVWYLKDDGSIEPMNGIYNAATGCMEFTTTHLSQYVIVSFPFTDVAESAWYYADVAYAYNNGLFSGTGEATFEPEISMSRAMLVTVLWRLEGEPIIQASGDSGFTDLTQDWYKEAVNWAAANSIVGGYGNGSFGPDDGITREQMAAILYRYAQHKGYDVSVGEDTNILSYTDAESVSEYAIPAMQWACGAKLIQGDDGKLMPQGDAERCQVAAILHRFCQQVAK